MYKSRLQELCHRRQWALPEYASSREGPGHDSRFRATVTVNGATFHSPDASCSSKEAQNKAAQVAFEQLSYAPPPPPLAPSPLPPTPLPALPLTLDHQISYKSQLQMYLQKKNKGLPSYYSVSDGSPVRRFKATVKVDGQTFESAGYFYTVKEAEHSAARVALMSLSLEGNQQDDPGIYKNLLQELVQKEGLSLPKYSTTSYGESHMPTFSATVEIKGECFQGDVAKTKKQAEMNAAKVALSHLYERRSSSFSSNLSSKLQVQIESEPASSGLEPVVNMNSLKRDALLVPTSQIKTEKTDDIIAADQETISTESTESLLGGQIINPTDEVMDTDEHDPVIAITEKDIATPVQKPEPVEVMKNRETLQGALSEGGSSALSSNSDCFNPYAGTASGELHTGRSICTLLCNRVRVYPRKSDLVLPKGAIPLPCSDDNWVAVSVDF